MAAYPSGMSIATVEDMSKTVAAEGLLDGHLLIAMPGMADPRFARSVIYVCAHSADGAMGIVINKLLPEIDFRELLMQLEIIDRPERDRLPTGAASIRVHRGGPVETGRGFVLHSSDFFLESATLPIADGICLTATLEILRAISTGRGPSRAILALGYAGWSPGQLESEIQANGWLHGPADKAILFDADIDSKYERALAKIGVTAGMLSTEAGHA